jgi:hypothetical protein
MKIKQEKQNNSNTKTFQFNIFYMLNIEINMPMNLSKAQNNTYQFKIIFILRIFI